ncbi:hypothetical protein [Labrenzia sp. OB1]|uniref:capsular polysaccharide export protein, LipB/KpsS family n=1 Tax=Labrenzia sp. OB1 TaxID=1561204 RepID=UPI0007B1E330|nr:hypothetical protein [Labrenzia sp. OB1]KZM49930.1 hypothetical protein OA90_10910 [Labrenzia sp. OB1]
MIDLLNFLRTISSLRRLNKTKSLKEIYNLDLSYVDTGIVRKIGRRIRELHSSRQEADIQILIYLWKSRILVLFEIQLLEHIEVYGTEDVRVKRLLVLHLFNQSKYKELVELFESPDYKNVDDAAINTVRQKLDKRQNFYEKDLDDEKDYSLIWGFAKEYGDVLDRLNSLTEGKILSISTSENSSFTLNNILSRNRFLEIVDKIDFGKIIKASKNSPKEFMHFCNLISRYTFETTNFDFGLRDFASIDHLYDLYYTFFAYLIDQKSIKAIVLTNMPHQGADYVLYLVARDKGIPTRILYQSIIPGRFFVFEKLEDFGEWKTSRQCYNREEVKELAEEQARNKIVNFATKVDRVVSMDSPINRYQVKRFVRYPSGVQEEIVTMESQVYSPVREIFRYRAFLAEGGLESILNAMRTALRHKKLEKIVSYRQPPINHYWSSEKVKFLLNSANAERQRVSFGHYEYIYLPLHYQPELTTSALGGEFINQMDAIEELAYLAKDIRILVKENPKQEDYMRPEEFYLRARKLENVEFVPIETDTKELIRHCALVATISGTVGFEAITFGKPVLTFGQAWYNTAPGVFRINDIENYEKLRDIIEHGAPTEEQVRDYMSDILQKMPIGVVGKPYERLVASYDHFENVERVADYVAKMLDEIKAKGN